MRSQDSTENSKASFDQKVLIIVNEARAAIQINDSLFASLKKAESAILSAQDANDACSIALDKEKAANALQTKIKDEELEQTKTALNSEIKRGKFWKVSTIVTAIVGAVLLVLK